MSESNQTSRAVDNMEQAGDAGKSFRLEVLTPQKSAFSGGVVSFTAPGTEGGFEVLHDHAPFLTTITVGEVKMQFEDGGEAIYSTSGGFVEVSKNSVIFLADTIERKDEIDVQRARSARQRAEERLKSKEEGIDLARARAALARSLNRLKIVGGL